MPRDHARAKQLEDELHELDEKRTELLEQIRENDPEVAQQALLTQQTISIGDLAFLLKVNDGKFDGQYSRLANRMVSDITANPYTIKGSKVVTEKREITISVKFEPVLRSEDHPDGKRHAPTYSIKQIRVTANCTLKTPKMQGVESLAHVRLEPNGSIADARINPSNPDEPTQLQFPEMGEE